MKGLVGLLFFLAATWSYSAVVVDEVRSIDYQSDEVIVTFWGNSQVFRLQKTNKWIPCLETSLKSDQFVGLVLASESAGIKSCKLVSKQHPGAQKIEKRRAR
jgi:hypothetical protein